MIHGVFLLPRQFRPHLQRGVDDEVHRSLALPRVEVVDQGRVVHDKNAVEGSRVPFVAGGVTSGNAHRGTRGSRGGEGQD